MNSPSRNKKNRRTRVVIVDDHDMVREGLSIFLRTFSDMQLSGEASSGEDAIRICDAASPDVLLMDLVMPGIGGVEAIRQIHEKHPGIKIIALSSFEEEPLVKAALRSGVTSYLLKNISANRLVEAIRSSLSGLATFAPEIALSLTKRASGRLKEDHFDLTPREKDIARLLEQGFTNHQISAELGISLNTAKNHVANILQKMGVRNRTQAATLLSRGAPK